MIDEFMSSRRNWLRVVNWKWQRAVQIVDEGAPGPTLARDGEEGAPMIRRLVRFYRGWQHYETLNNDDRRRGRLTLQDQFWDIFMAHAIHTDPSYQTARYSTEAYILARESNQEIAERVGGEASVINVYESCFFNVRRRLDQKIYILQAVFGESVHRGLNARDYDLLWKLMGYIAGPHALASIIDPIASPGRCESADRVMAFWRQLGTCNLSRRAAIAAITTPLNIATAMPLMEVNAKYQELDRAVDMHTPTVSILENIGGMLGILKDSFRVGSHVGALDDSPLGKAREMGAVEYRGSELLRLAAGQTLPNEQELSEITWPKPIK